MANEAAWKTNSNFKMAALIVKGGSLLSVGFNRIEEHPAAYFGCSFHAEYDAIRKARGDITGAKMFVYRFGRSDRELRVSKPCDICQNKIAEANIGSVVFVDTDMILKRETFRDVEISSPHDMHEYFGYGDIYVR